MLELTFHPVEDIIPAMTEAEKFWWAESESTSFISEQDEMLTKLRAEKYEAARNREHGV